MLRVDLHCHTSHSPDALIAPAELVERAAEAGLDRVAVTDHDEITGALEARAIDPERVIVGEEIRCRDGTELIGLFLSRRIPPGLPLQETVARIRDQDGVVYLPHPYAYLRGPVRRAGRALPFADVVEVANARAFLPVWNRRAADAARGRELPGCAGSDAHFPVELGRAYTEMPEFRDVESFRAALAGAEPVLRRTSGPHVHAASVLCKGWRLAMPERRWGDRRTAGRLWPEVGAQRGGPASG